MTNRLSSLLRRFAAGLMAFSVFAGGWAAAQSEEGTGPDPPAPGSPSSPVDPGSLTEGVFSGREAPPEPATTESPVPSDQPESREDAPPPEIAPRPEAVSPAEPEAEIASPPSDGADSSDQLASPPSDGADSSDQAASSAAESEQEELPEEPQTTKLQPVPDSGNDDSVVVQAASLKGVTPGKSTMEEVETAWGAPKEVVRQDGMTVQLYRVEPFDSIEVSYRDDLVASVVVRFQRAFPASTVAEQLELAPIQPVLVSNESGEVLGQAYPERGVLFAFEPGDTPERPSMQVSQIILEPVRAESFVLRAETRLNKNNELCQRDLHQALELEPENAQAHWLLSRALAAMGEYDAALQAAEAAVTHDPRNARYLISRAKLLGQTGQLQQGITASKKAVALAEGQPHVQARAWCLTGDLLASGAEADYAQALKSHVQAIRVADGAATSERPSVRRAAKEVLLDGHLGAAHDLAWGHWKDKEAAVPKWIGRAARLADDLVDNENAGVEHRFRMAARVLAAGVGMRGQFDPDRWTRQALTTGRQLIDGAEEPARKAQLRWDLGMALYDAVQVYQMRSDHDTAVRYGEEAVEYLERGRARQASPTASYLLGRLYFRLGAIHAIRDGAHRVAIGWFEKALPHLKKPVSSDAFGNLGRRGETFVSMGVSYWETGQREKAVELTEHGTELMRKAVEEGSLDEDAMQVPFANLAAMHRDLGAEEKAEEFEQLAKRPGDTPIK